MSSLGMEQHEYPKFELADDETGGPCFWWQNPWTSRREKIASLWWPEHPADATEAVEHLFENLVLEYKP